MIHLLNVCPCRIVQVVVHLAAWFLALLLLSWCLPRETGQPLRTFLFRFLHGSGHVLSRSGRVLFVGLRRWVEEGKEDDKKAGKKRKKS